MAAVPEAGRFITGDEIAASLANGSGFEGGKARIYEFFQTPHTPKESADFLKRSTASAGVPTPYPEKAVAMKITAARASR